MHIVTEIQMREKYIKRVIALINEHIQIHYEPDSCMIMHLADPIPESIIDNVEHAFSGKWNVKYVDWSLEHKNPHFIIESIK